MSVETTSGRMVVTDEYCRFCGRTAGQMHPAGVIAGGNWKCLACGGLQHEAHQGDDYLVIDPRYSIELVGELVEILGDPINDSDHLEGMD